MSYLAQVLFKKLNNQVLVSSIVILYLLSQTVVLSPEKSQGKGRKDFVKP